MERRGETYLLAAQVANLLNVSPKTVSRWAAEGKLPYTRTLGGHRRFSASFILDVAEGISDVTDTPSIEEVLRRMQGS